MPEVQLARFLAQLAKKTPAVVLLLGEDAYLKEKCRTGIVEANVPEASRPWAVTRISLHDEELETIFRQAQTLPMLAPRQVIFVEGTERLEKLGDDARDEAIQVIAAYLEDPAPFSVLVFEAGKLDERMKLAKQLFEKAAVVRVELSAADPAQAIELAATLTEQMAAEAGVGIEPEAAAQLADCLDGALGPIRTEVEKLATFIGKGKTITTSDVTALVVAAKKYTVWQLADMLALGERRRAMQFLDSVLREGQEPAAIVGALTWMYRALLMAQELPGHTNKFQAAGRLRMRPDTAEMAMRQSRAMPRERLLRGIEALAEADSRLKSGVGASGRAVMELLLTELTARYAPAEGAR